MLKDLIAKSWMDKDSILNQINDEFNRGHSYVRNIRKEFTAEDKLFRNEKKKKEKLGDFTYYSVYTALMARSYVNAPEASFEVTVGNKQIVDKLNHVIQQDFKETNMETLKYFRDSNKFKRWVGIIAKKWWDWFNKRGTFANIDPRMWIPDPDWDYINGQYAFTGFQDDIYKKDLESLAWTEVINFDELSDKKEDDGSKYTKETDKRNAGLIYTQSRAHSYNPNYDIYYHFSYFNGHPAMVLTANERTEILKVVVYKAVTKEEKANPSVIQLPFAFTQWIPDGTPFWLRVPHFTADPQRAKAIMANLRMDKELAELYPMYLRNTNMIPNRWDIEFGFNKLIDVTPLEWQWVKDALLPLSKDFRADNSYLVEQSIDRWVAGTTSIDKVTQWSLPSRRETAETNNLVQDNVDINLALAEKIEAWWEKQLLKLMLRAYQENFTEGDVKEVTMKTSYGLLGVQLKKKDFLSETSLRITVITKTDLNKETEKQKLALWNAIWMIEALPITESGKKFLYREYFEKIWMDKEQAERIVDYSPDEIEAMTNVFLLNEWIFVPVQQHYDPMTHLTALKWARPGENTDMYKYLLMSLYKIKWDTTPRLWGATWIWSNIAAQAGANIANESRQLNAV